jgi:two-component system phosphate regulon response regulator PhoB
MSRIFLIEDNDSLREAVASYLKLNEHEVNEFPRGAGVLEALATAEPDLLILDIMLPDANGLQLAKKIRSKYRVPIIFLTAKTSESDRITGFEVGGDDYVVKPFSPRELVLRVEAVLRRSKGEERKSGKKEWVIGEDVLAIDFASHKAWINDAELPLTPAEWKILEYFVLHPDVVVDRSRLLGESLDYLVASGSERTVDTHVKNLRAKLRKAEWIETVRGFGYRFSARPLEEDKPDLKDGPT